MGSTIGGWQNGYGRRMIYLGDLFDVLPTLAAESIDSCVTDPPYGIGVMGKEWDTFKPGSTGSVPNQAIESGNPNLKGRQRSPASSPSSIAYDRRLSGQREFQAWTERWAREVVERDEGCYDLPSRTPMDLTGRKEDSAGLKHARAGTDRKATNHHPTVKPVTLMQWLVKLVTPPGGTVLGPFMGSGTTGMAARLADLQFIGIEREAEYVEIARRRISETNALFSGEEEVK